MIDRIISFSVRNKLITGLLLLALVGWGAYSVTQLPIDALPDVTNNQVLVNTVAPNLATQEVVHAPKAPLHRGAPRQAWRTKSAVSPWSPWFSRITYRSTSRAN